VVRVQGIKKERKKEGMNSKCNITEELSTIASSRLQLPKKLLKCTKSAQQKSACTPTFKYAFNSPYNKCPQQCTFCIIL
jgi:hypothetical protein